MARTRIFCICALWPWPWRYDLGSRSWHTPGSWITIVRNIIQIQLGSEELRPGHGFSVCVQWPWPWRYDLGSKVITHPWVMDNNCVKYYPDPTSGHKVMARTRSEQMDGQGDSCIPLYNQTSSGPPQEAPFNLKVRQNWVTGRTDRGGNIAPFFRFHL